MIIDFDNRREGESITIIEDGIAKTYCSPSISLSYVKCFPPTNDIRIDITGEFIIVEKVVKDSKDE